MDRKAAGTHTSNQTEQRLVRLERAIWALVLLLSCVLAAMLVAYVWMFVWGHGPDAGTVIASTPPGGA